MNSNKIVSNRHGSAVVTLPSDTEILITRAFDAPAALVFKAWTTPELVKRWWGFETSEWLVCEVDLRVGGRWRWVIREREMEVGFHGEYREIDRPHRLVNTEVYEGFPDGQAVNIMTLTEVDGVTTMTTLVQHSCKEHRDGHINSGMEGGMQVSYNRMEDVVVELQRAAAA
ncbi:SRPBCC family protein [Nannocystis sp. SCPEA4]|uniref:SRPBCC family protein n=1 Tax=Nannocystis sp. SCPEA4 TaxID=2996787 RepID=UPI00226E57CC|nr:SRPBCC family protein [Nannocystis sp. SCPEA4]MCY1059685.1 SRPBCC family protein [Nannocystis sp. SCPEA4]